MIFSDRKTISNYVNKFGRIYYILFFFGFGRLWFLVSSRISFWFGLVWGERLKKLELELEVEELKELEPE